MASSTSSTASTSSTRTIQYDTGTRGKRSSKHIYADEGELDELALIYSDEARMRAHIRKKVRGYAAQDERADRPTEDNICVESTIQLLQKSKLICEYCKCKVRLFGESRAPDIWTLDRKENHIAHTASNVVVCCLRCNLKKRRQDTAKFSLGGVITREGGVVRKGYDNM